MCFTYSIHSNHPATHSYRCTVILHFNTPNFIDVHFLCYNYNFRLVPLPCQDISKGMQFVSFTLTQRKKKEEHLVNTCSVITLHEILYEIFFTTWVRQQFDSNKKSYCDLTNFLDKKFVFKAKVYLHSQNPHLVVVSKTFSLFWKKVIFTRMVVRMAQDNLQKLSFS